jgi:Spy/CpxP family protein refolding chaperone
MMRRLPSCIIVVVAASLGVTGSLRAQRAFSSPGTTSAAAPRQRAQLEQRLRQRIATVVKKRLQLTDEQFGKLVNTNRVYEQQRQELLQQERATRLGLRAEILAGEHADQAHVAKLVDRLVSLQRQRLDLLAREQEDLSHFLTPVQRAQYMAIEEQVRRRVEQLRRNAPAARKRNGVGAGNGPSSGPGLGGR